MIYYNHTLEEQLRLSWHDWALGIAEAVAKRGACSRSQVGAVILDADHNIVSVGYNGAERGGPSCLAGECPRAFSSVEPGSSYDTGPGACIATHAEGNCLLYAGRDKAKQGSLYVTREPCGGCMKLIKAAGIAEVYWPEGHIICFPKAEDRPEQ